MCHSTLRHCRIARFPSPIIVAMELIDTHTHLDDGRFDNDREAVMERAAAHGVSRMVVPAIQAAGWPPLRSLCQRYPQLAPAYGLHPMFMHCHHSSHIDELAHWLEREKCVAVGECGLDYFIPEPDKRGQRRLFEAQLELASQHRLPVIVHARKSVEEVINILRAFPDLKGVLHSFSGSRQQAERLIEMKFMFGIGGPVTYSNARKLRPMVAWLPLTSLLLETDSPDQPDAAHRGERNEPGYLTNIVTEICELKQIASETLAQQTTANAVQLFGLDNRPE